MGITNITIPSCKCVAMTNRTFDVWVAVGTVVGGGIATFLAVLGGAAVAASHYRREREQRSAVAVLVAIAGFRQGTNFLSGGLFTADERTSEVHQRYDRVVEEMRQASAERRDVRMVSHRPHWSRRWKRSKTWP